MATKGGLGAGDGVGVKSDRAQTKKRPRNVTAANEYLSSMILYAQNVLQKLFMAGEMNELQKVQTSTTREVGHG